MILKMSLANENVNARMANVAGARKEMSNVVRIRVVRQSRRQKMEVFIARLTMSVWFRVIRDLKLKKALLR
jgi:hypothetical protein